MEILALGVVAALLVFGAVYAFIDDPQPGSRAHKSRPDSDPGGARDDSKNLQRQKDPYDEEWARRCREIAFSGFLGVVRSDPGVTVVSSIDEDNQDAKSPAKVGKQKDV